MVDTCPSCGKDACNRKFCPFCGAKLERREQPTEPLAQGPPPGPVAPAGPAAMQQAPPPGAPAKPAKRNATLWAVIASVFVVAVVTGVVLAVVLTGGKQVLVKITSPGPGEEVSAKDVRAEATVSEGGNVGRVGFYVDGLLQESVTSAPYEARVPSGDKGTHQLKAAAYDANGKLLADATVTFETTRESGTDEGTTGDEGTKNTEQAYKDAVFSSSGESRSLDLQIKSAADKINSQISHGISSSLLSEVQGVYNKTVALQEKVRALDAPRDMLSIQAQLLELCGYLETRADALVKGCEAANASRSYTADFNRGAVAKTQYDAAWPKFVSACQAKGITVGMPGV